MIGSPMKTARQVEADDSWCILSTACGHIMSPHPGELTWPSDSRPGDLTMAVRYSWRWSYPQEFAWIAGDMMSRRPSDRIAPKVVGLDLTRRFSGLANHGSAPGPPPPSPISGKFSRCSSCR